jgi:hypothetical protein
MNQNSFCTKCHRIPSQCVCGGTFRELTDEEIHNIYLHQSGVSEGLLRAGADSDFPVLFANALLEFYELRKAQEK